jgi:hypothetical protein
LFANLFRKNLPRYCGALRGGDPHEVLVALGPLLDNFGDLSG